MWPLAFGNCGSRPWMGTVSCPWNATNATAYFDRRPQAPWSFKGDPDIAGRGVLYSFAAFAGIYSLCHFIQSSIMLLWPECEVDWEASNARTGVRALRALQFSVEDTLLITGFAVYAAVRAHSCSITMYHFKLLCWLFAVLISICSAIYNTGQSAIWYKLKEVTEKHLASAPSAVAQPARWRSFFLHVRGNFMLLLLFLLSIYLGAFAAQRSPDFPQQAIAGPAHCFMLGRGARPYNATMRKEYRPLVVAFLGALAPSLSLGFAHSVVFMLSFVRTDISRNGDQDEMNERDTPKNRLLRRLQAVEGLIYASCNITGMILVFQERSKAKKYLDSTTSEREWTFGQIVTMVLLGTPLLVFIEVLTGFDEHRLKGERLSLPTRASTLPGGRQNV